MDENRNRKSGKWKKILIAVVILVAFFALLGSCGGDDNEETPNSETSKELAERMEKYCEAIKAFDLEGTDEYLGSEPDYYVNMNEGVLDAFTDIFEESASDIEYTVGTVDVDEEQDTFSWGNVTVQFRFHDYSEVMTASMERLENEFETGAISSEASDEELYSRLHEIFVEEQGAADESWLEKEVAFSWVKNRNKSNPIWYLNSIPEDISVILTCNTESSFESYSGDQTGTAESDENHTTPQDYIFSGTRDDCLTYVYIKETEVITASRYYLMGENTDLVDITFTSYAEDYEDDGIGDSIYGFTAGDRNLSVRRSGFNDDSCSVTVYDEEYSNLDEPIIVTFSDDMSSIDVTATWKAGVLNEQAIFDGHYELYGTYTTDELVDCFYEDGIQNFENIVGFDGDSGTSDAESGETETFEIWTLAGEYEGENVTPPTNMAINIYSSPEEDIVGNFIITKPNSGIEYMSEFRMDSDKTFSSSNDEFSASFEVIDATPDAVVIHYSEADFECDFRMYEAYPMP